MSGEDGTVDKSDQPVTISAPPAGTITIDPQNPLPEPSFLHRRIIAYIVVITSLALIWFIAEAFHDLGATRELLTVAKWSIGFSGLISTYYYIAPSAAELTQIIQSARIIKSGIRAAGNAQDSSDSARKPGQERENAPPPYTGRPEDAERPSLPPSGEDEEEDAAPTRRQ